MNVKKLMVLGLFAAFLFGGFICASNGDDWEIIDFKKEKVAGLEKEMFDNLHTLITFLLTDEAHFQGSDVLGAERKFINSYKNAKGNMIKGIRFRQEENLSNAKRFESLASKYKKEMEESLASIISMLKASNMYKKRSKEIMGHHEKIISFYTEIFKLIPKIA